MGLTSKVLNPAVATNTFIDSARARAAVLRQNATDPANGADPDSVALAGEVEDLLLEADHKLAEFATKNGFTLS